jgi:hypothetical protein
MQLCYYLPYEKDISAIKEKASQEVWLYSKIKKRWRQKSA